MNKKITTHTILLDTPVLVSVDDDGLPDIKTGTIRAYRLACRSLVKSGLVERQPPFEYQPVSGITLGEISPKDIHNWHRWLIGEPMSVHTANSYRRSLKALFRKLRREDLARPIHQMKPPPRKSKAISDFHLAKILTHASLRDAAMIMFMRDSGVRRGAVCSLLARNVRVWQSDTGDWRLAAKIFTKGDQTALALAGHQCALAVNLWLSIRAAQDAKHLFVTNEGDRLSEHTLNSIFRNLRIRAKIPASANIFPHALRHRFAHKMLSEFDAKIVSQLMGHADVHTTLQIYGHRTEDELMEAYFERGSNQV